MKLQIIKIIMKTKLSIWDQSLAVKLTIRCRTLDNIHVLSKRDEPWRAFIINAQTQIGVIIILAQS